MWTAKRVRLLIFWLALIPLSSSGCHRSKYTPIVETDTATGTQYHLEMVRVDRGGGHFHSTIWKSTSGKKKIVLSSGANND